MGTVRSAVPARRNRGRAAAMARKTWSHVDDPNAVGRRLRAARERAGLSQRQLSFPGCTAAYISRVESGDRIPSLQLLREIGKRLGVSADWIATGKEPDPAGDPLALAELTLRIGDARTAERLFAAARDAPDPPVRARALAGLGRLSLLGGDPALAVSRLEEARAALGEDAAARLPELVEALAEAHAAAGKPGMAVRILDDALSRAGSDAIVSAHLSVALAGALVEAGDTARADALLDAASNVLAALGDPTTAARLLWDEADRASDSGEPALAARYARQALGALEFRDGAQLAVEAAHLRASLAVAREEGPAPVAK
jgi:transcriptional regulator with XRE-family HTH domain